jgi:hypothetical protein
MPPHTVRTTTVQAAHQRKEPVERWRWGGKFDRPVLSAQPGSIALPFNKTRAHHFE